MASVLNSRRVSYLKNKKDISSWKIHTVVLHISVHLHVLCDNICYMFQIFKITTGIFRKQSPSFCSYGNFAANIHDLNAVSIFIRFTILGELVRF